MVKTVMILAMTAALGNFYPRAMQVTALDYEQDIVTCEDAVGFIWEFYGTEDYEVHDMVSCIMYDNCTENITDDWIVKAQYAGYWKD